MKIIKNTSGFKTRKLKSLFSLIHNQIARIEGRLCEWKKLKVVLRRKSEICSYSGRAYLGTRNGDGWDIFLSVSDDLKLEMLSQLFAHELMHSYGYRHKQYRTHPLDKHHLDEIAERFKIEDLQKDVEIKKPRKSVKSYKQKLEELVKDKNSYISFEKDPCQCEEFRFEVWDTRTCGEECANADDLDVYDVRTNLWSWKEAYEFAIEVNTRDTSDWVVCEYCGYGLKDF